MPKYKYVIYDNEGLLVDSYFDYAEVFDTYEEAEKECLHSIEETQRSCAKNHEDSFIKGYDIMEVRKDV